jgi:hypothetical protein
MVTEGVAKTSQARNNRAYLSYVFCVLDGDIYEMELDDSSTRCNLNQNNRLNDRKVTI